MALDSFTRLRPGNPWPAFTEQSRVNAYRQFERWYRGEHTVLQPGNVLPVHWFRRVSQLWSEMLFSRPPTFTYDGMTRVMDWVEAQYPALMVAAADGALDVSRYGTTVLRVEAHSDRLVFDAEHPADYAPVIDPVLGSIYVGDVFGYPYVHSRRHEGDVPDRIRFLVHDFQSGQLSERIHGYNGNVIGELLDSRDLLFGRFMSQICRVPNGAQRDGWGDSDYIAIAPLIAEMERRYAQNTAVLDRHGDPHLAVPEGAIETDSAGRAVAVGDGDGRVFPVADGDTPPSYVTWDGQLAGSMEQIQAMQDLVFAFSGLSAAMFSGRKNLGTIESGVALRSRYLATHLRLESARRRWEQCFRDILEAAAHVQRAAGMESVPFQGNRLDVTWEDIFPAEDPQEPSSASPGQSAMNPAGPQRTGTSERVQ